MSLRDRIQTDITASMRSRDALRRDVLRMAQNAAYLSEKTLQRPLTDAEVEAIVAREVKTRRESVDAFRKGNREDLAAKEEAEIAILVDYLPVQLDDAALAALVDDAIRTSGASSARDMGKVMALLAPQVKDRADGRRVAELVAQGLARADLASHADKAHADEAHADEVHADEVHAEEALAGGTRAPEVR